MNPGSIDRAAWQKKAAAFVTRCHQHLFGKNNEDPLVFLFRQGIKNEFAKQMLIGWNKFSQERPMENWGLGPGKLFLPKGLVIPYIVEKELKSVFIHEFDAQKENKTLMVPGSAHSCMVLKAGPDQSSLLVDDIMKGLFLFQEKKHSGRIIIHPDPDTPMESH